MSRSRKLLVLALACAAALAAVASPQVAAKPAKGAKGHHGKGKRPAKKKRAISANVLKPVGWTPLTSAEAAKLVTRSGWEPRPGNYAANHTVPSATQLAEWRAGSSMPNSYLVDGRFKGTTDEIIQWAAYKWGLPVEAMRAVAALETWWEQDHVGDNGDSFGLYQQRRPYHCSGECTIVKESTAFDADYYGAIIRSYYEGKETWLNTVSSENGAPYAAGDFWGSVGAWCSGRWHDARAEEYVAAAKRYLASKPWLTPEFIGQ